MLIGHWPLAGNINDYSGFGNNAINDGVSWSTGKIGQSGFFDGTGTRDGVTPGANIVIDEQLTNTNNYPNGCTYSFWINVDVNAPDRMSLFFGASTIRHIEIYSSGKYFRTEAALQNGYSFGSSAFPDNVRGEWSHFSIVFANNEDSRPVRWYQNGKLFHTGTLDGGLNPGTEYFSFNRIGRSTGTVDFQYAPSFHGKINDMRIYDKVLSKYEIKELSRAKVFHFNFSEKISSDLTSYSKQINEVNMVYSNNSKIGEYCYDNDFATDRYISISDSPNITGDQTIAMWLYPTSFVTRMNPWNKAYGGEGTITHETSGSLNYYWGTNGGNGTPYQSLGSSFSTPVNQWTHVAIVRDITNGKLKWYVNGVFSNETSTSYTAAALTTSPLIIGDGYTSTYRGKIDDVREYGSALNDAEIKALYIKRANLDSGGNLSINSIIQTKHTALHMDYTIWEDGQTGSIGDFSTYSSNNERVIDVDPWGKQTVVWQGISTNGSTTGTGIYYNPKPVDNTKLYRMTWWEKRVTNGDATYGRYYAGLNAYGTTSGVWNLTSDTYNTNPYFWSTSHLGLPVGEWFLVVGHIWPHTYTAGVTHQDSGRYFTDGTKIGSINTDYRWAPDTITGRSRTLMIYQPASTIDPVIHQTCYPRMDIIDGTEPSLDDLIAGHDSRNIEYIREIGGTINKPFDIQKNITYITDMDEVSGTENPIAQHEIKKDGNLVINGEFSEVD